MQRLCLIFLVAFALAPAPVLFAQAQASSAPKQKSRPPAPQDEDNEDEAEAAKPNTSSVPGNAPVITIEGLCDATKSAGAAAKTDCKTVITRSEFEKFANALQPNMAPAIRKQLANQYPRLLVMSREAQRRGLDKDPRYLESLKFAKLQLLNLELNRRMQEEAGKISDKDLQEYYDKNVRSFEQASLQRVFVPRTKQLEPAKEGASAEEQKARTKESEDAMSKVAADLRARAVAGEGFEKLEKDAYEAAGIKANPPATSIPNIRRVNLPASHASVFDLKSGEVSPLINDPGGYFFYKVQSKRVPTLDEVKPEIHATLQSQRMREQTQKLQDSVTTQLNDAYFNPPPAATPASAVPGTPADNTNKANAKADQKE